MGPQSAPKTVSRRQYATRRGCSEKAIRKHIESGLLKPALRPDGRLDPDAADRLLATSVTAGTAVPSSLAAARIRKAAASCALLADELADLRRGYIDPGEIHNTTKPIVQEIARRLFQIADDALPLILGKSPPEIYSILTDLVRGALCDISGHADDEADKPERQHKRQRKASGPKLSDMTAIELAARRVNLAAEKLEIKRAIAVGDLVEIAAVGEIVGDAMRTGRSRILAIPNNVSGQLEGADQTEARRILETQIADAIKQLACEWIDEAFLAELIAVRHHSEPRRRRNTRRRKT